MLSRNRAKPVRQDNSDINVTPMLDIVFIMLIFFIVTTSFVKEDTIEPKRPTTNQDTTPPKNPPPLIVVSVDAQSNVFMKERSIDPEAIRANIETQLAVDPRSPVLVRIHEDARHELLVSALDQSRAALACTEERCPVNIARWVTED